MLLLIGLLLFASTALAQNDSNVPNQAAPLSMTFDVISIRPIKVEPGHAYYTEDGGFQPLNSSHYRMKSVALLSLLGSAFSLKYYQLPLSSIKQFSPPIPPCTPLRLTVMTTQTSAWQSFRRSSVRQSSVICYKPY